MRAESCDHPSSHAALVLISACILCLVACTGSEALPAPGSAGSTVPLPAADSESAPVDLRSLEALVEIARRDLAAHLAVEIDSIRRVDARRVTWPSAAVGCPRPGMAYAQALVPGSLIVLQFGQERFAYHARNGAEPFYCPAERAQQPVPEARAPSRTTG